MSMRAASSASRRRNTCSRSSDAGDGADRAGPGRARPMRRRAPFAAVMAALFASLTACAPTLPDLNGPEYRLSWGLAAVNAEPAYRAGATGRGVTVALIDCGLDDAQPELARNVRASMDLFAGKRTVADFDRHASYV